MCGVQTWPSVGGVQLCTDLRTQNGSIDFSLDVRVVSWASRKSISRTIPQWTAVPFPNCARHPSLRAHCDSPRHTLSSGAKSSETSWAHEPIPWDGPSATCPPIDLTQSKKRLQAGSAGYSMSISSIVLLLDLKQNAHDLRMYRYFFQTLWPTDCPRVAEVPAELGTQDLKKTPNGVWSADEQRSGVARVEYLCSQSPNCHW